MSQPHAWQQCIHPECAAQYDLMQVLPKCPKCGNLLDIVYDWNTMNLPDTAAKLGKVDVWPSGGLGAVSGVWRFGALLPWAPEDKRVTIGEGHTQLRFSPNAADYAGVSRKTFRLQYEGLNPSGSFKDNGMAGAFTHANMVGAKVAACASTGNTSASLAAFASASGLMRAVIFIGDGKIAYGKLSQALDYGAVTMLVKGDFDDAMARVQEVCAEEGIYLVNSVNPFRLEGQKTIMYRVLEGLDWNVPDWIVCPGGNLGNSSAFAKALYELYDHGLIDKMPRLAVVNSSGAPTFSRLVNHHKLTWNKGHVDDAVIKAYYDGLDARGEKAHTLASAIEINRPVNLKKCLRGIERTNGVALEVSDQAILDAKAWIAKDGLGCEPASAASLAGAKVLVERGVIDRDSSVVCILTGHQLKDPHATVAYHSAGEAKLKEDYGEFGVATAAFANRPIPVANSLGDIVDAVRKATAK